MELQAEKLFDLLESAYRNGVTDKLTPLLGEVIDDLKARTGLNMEDFLNAMDGAREDSIDRFNRVLGLMAPLLPLLGGDLLMRATARLLDLQPVRRMTVWGLTTFFEMKLAGYYGGKIPLTRGLKELPAALAGKPVKTPSALEASLFGGG